MNEALHEPNIDRVSRAWRLNLGGRKDGILFDWAPTPTAGRKKKNWQPRLEELLDGCHVERPHSDHWE
jgi:hypothetical protein